VDVEYTILFPFEADPRVEGLSFEIEILFPSPLNERRERFRTIGLDMEGDAPAGKSATYEPEEERQLHTRLQCMEIEGTSTLMFCSRLVTKKDSTERCRRSNNIPHPIASISCLIS
jgi:hypothetical protein